MNIAEMVQGYVAAALWSSTDDAGNPLDSDGYRLTKATRRAMAWECQLWAESNAGLVAELRAVADEYGYGAHPDCGCVDPVAAAIGHDLWLTRNRHGAGFWDRGLPGDLGARLTEAAHRAGERSLYAVRRWVYQH